MQLLETVGLDPNTLPYFVRNVAFETVPVRFAPLTLSDLPEINGPRWAGAVFAQTWAGFAGDGHTLKLVKTTETGQNIEGLVHLGHVPLGSRALRDSLLETAPANQHRMFNRSLVGAGRV